MRVLVFGWMLVISGSVAGQSSLPTTTPWQMQDSGTTAGLRGIDSVDGTIAWASGTGGTVLKTIDGGAHWTTCAVPDAAMDGATLDFRGVQAFDAQTAIVMASGPGEKSRLYKTADGCARWELLATNDDPEGFWDAIRMWTPTDGFLAGDPVAGHPFLSEFTSYNGIVIDNQLFPIKSRGGEGAFAAGNACITLGLFSTKNSRAREVWFVTGGTSGSRVIFFQHFNGGEPERVSYSVTQLPGFPRASAAGAFAIASFSRKLIAVGGDYTKPNDRIGTAVYSSDGGKTWTIATKPPHGYRSAVQWSEALKLWITVGTNGSDVSRDDGKTWQPLDDGNWNALSLPFVVGPGGRIARLNRAALQGGDK
jgi:photosystem II stability/assembly factor-like uncharacterized protein